MELEESQNKPDLYKKIKIVKGEGFITIEDTKKLTNQELMELIEDLRDKSFIKAAKNVNIVFNNQINKEVDFLLRNNDFKLHGETVTVYKLLAELSEGKPGFSLRNLNDISITSFKDIWRASMEGSLNEPPSLSIDEQMRSVEVELGPSYKKSCMAAYENVRPIGVIIPHIEPGTLDEGRMFYFGLVPRERGKGKSKILHQQALNILKSELKASYYIGCTGVSNLPMLKTFENNGCTVLEVNKVYKRKAKM
ncbi:GNAT family N-acetyltransferase [Sediminibacillus albus]|uniref:N-acetyltransferase domain-containing protein n=1 Tax=Sediminibacillus albus TaxID=407036 RepID=A0A1G9BB44_9BACI|nr:GNAT family N-acetyltransferase [Sediminibacillus albus]SDK36105.1 hypothetical protein SAMN05216243_2892 [Sediminibacillus albus]